MAAMRGLAILLLASLVLGSPQSQDGKSDQAGVSPYDPQLLNYQLQQLALQQYGSVQDQSPQAQQYETQPAQFPTIPPSQAQQIPAQQISPQQISDQYLQQKLFQPAYQTQFANEQLIGQAGQVRQQPQQTPKQSLLGVAYSSAADASRTSFTGYGIKYSF